MAAPINYDFRQVVVTVAGVPIEGFADGDSIGIERAADDYTMVVGNDGEGARSKQNNKSGSITLTLMNGAASNAYLQGIYLADDVSGAGAVPVVIADLRGSLLAGSTAAWIKKLPSAPRGRDNGSTEWVFDTTSLEIVHGLSTRAGI
jgi:hypothetical protein